jgi:hypothetical protein
LDSIVAGTAPCTLMEAAEFAALQLQIRFGNLEERAVDSPENILDDLRCVFICMYVYLFVCYVSFLNTTNRWEEYLPPDLCPHFRRIERELLSSYKRLHGVTPTEAKSRYIKETRSLKTFGYTFFPVEKFLDTREPEKILLGISKEAVMIVDAESKNILFRCHLEQIVQWKVVQHKLFLYYLEDADEFHTSDASSISHTLEDYVAWRVRSAGMCFLLSLFFLCWFVLCSFLFSYYLEDTDEFHTLLKIICSYFRCVLCYLFFVCLLFVFLKTSVIFINASSCFLFRFKYNRIGTKSETTISTSFDFV